MATTSVQIEMTALWVAPAGSSTSHSPLNDTLLSYPSLDVPCLRSLLSYSSPLNLLFSLSLFILCVEETRYNLNGSSGSANRLLKLFRLIQTVHLMLPVPLRFRTDTLDKFNNTRVLICFRKLNGS